MIAWLISFVSSAAFRTIAGELSAAYKARATERNLDKQREHDERIADLEAQKTALFRSLDMPITHAIKALWAAPFIIYLWKIIIWDRILGLGVTDDLSPEQYAILTICLGGYFWTGRQK